MKTFFGGSDLKSEGDQKAQTAQVQEAVFYDSDSIDSETWNWKNPRFSADQVENRDPETEIANTTSDIILAQAKDQSYEGLSAFQQRRLMNRQRDKDIQESLAIIEQTEQMLSNFKKPSGEKISTELEELPKLSPYDDILKSLESSKNAQIQSGSNLKTAPVNFFRGNDELSTRPALKYNNFTLAGGQESTDESHLLSESHALQAQK